MFQKACSLIFPCVCNVGGCSSSGKAKLFGMGCLLGGEYAITAWHVVKRGMEGGRQAAVAANAGLWKCRVIYKSSDQDIALLQMEHKVAPGIDGADIPKDFPPLGGSRLTFGLSVGYFGRLHRDDPLGKPTSHTFFASGSLSFMKHDPLRWALSAGFAEEGFSGSPVFATEGHLVGVLTELMPLAEPTPGRIAQLVSVPMMSPINGEVVKEISKAAGVDVQQLG
jgi:hypothetical protein